MEKSVRHFSVLAFFICLTFWGVSLGKLLRIFAYLLNRLNNRSSIQIFWSEWGRWGTTTKVYKRKKARLKFIKSQSGIAIFLYLVATKKLLDYRRIVPMYSFFNLMLFESISNMAIPPVKSRQPRVSFSLVIGSAA